MSAAGAVVEVTGETPFAYIVTVNECSPGPSGKWKDSSVHVDYCSDGYSFRKLYYPKDSYTREAVNSIVATKLGDGCPRCMRIRDVMEKTIARAQQMVRKTSVEDVTRHHEKHIKEEVVASTRKLEGGNRTMVGTDTIKKRFIGQFLGRTIHLAAKYADIKYQAGLTAADGTDAMALKDVPLDQWDISKRYTFYADSLGGALLVGAAAKGYGSPNTQEIFVDAGVNLLTNVEDIVVNKLFSDKQTEPFIPGYSIPQQFRTTSVPLSPRAPTVATKRQVEAIPGM